MNVTRKEQRIIQRALNAWQASGELTPSDSQRLAQTMRVSPFDWRRLSRYAFWRFCFWASSLPPWRYGSLANGWITAAAISHRCFWPDA